MSVQGLAYRGSVTSIFQDDALPASILELRRFFQHLRVFDTLSPQLLRRRNKQVRGTIGYAGEHLASFYAELPEKVRDDIASELSKIYPRMRDLVARELTGGWKEISIRELFEPNAVSTPSRHINDGFLRILAILTELYGTSSFLLFDEIENGINAELVEFLVEKLTGGPRQVLVTTHSPIILNYLDDETARESVVLLHKGDDGRTKSTRFFEIPSIREKLDVMGAGEAFVDTNLVALSDELNAAGVE
jgi:predicted ATPase